MYKGRITGKSVLEIEFRAYYSENLSLGDILIAEDIEDKTKYLLRIVDIKYGVEASDPDWPNRTAGNMMLMDSMKRPFELHDKERRLYKIGQCVPLGCIKKGSFRKAKSLPSHFSMVSAPSTRDFEFLKKFMGDIEIGNLRSGESVLDFNIGINGSLFPYHVGVFATTGMGKSNLMKVLAGSTLISKKYGMLIFDPHGEYYDGGGDRERKGLMDAPFAQERLRVYSTRSLSGPYNQLKISAQEIQIDDLQQIYNFSGPQIEALYSITYHYKKNWLLALASEEPETILDNIGGNAFHIGTISVLKRRAEHIARLPFVHGDQTVSITKNIISDLRNGYLVLVDTSNMRQDEELLTSAIIARAVFETNKEAYQKPSQFKKVPPTLIVLEEAQRVLGKGSERNLGVFAQIAREGRKFKTGLCAITQQPKLIDEELLSQFNTLFILGLADERDRSILRNSAKHDISALGNEIQTLMAGEALITAPENPFALPAKIFLYEDWI
ncbi:ATP-binding protein, partial [Candidatus Oleimmundimicrobium sp.]|uniref:ATP-binding protein n=1 Tax=Candidatus Oleimmundimicrobium sp. TaxID=3060597 RepID=UPI00272679F2